MRLQLIWLNVNFCILFLHNSTEWQSKHIDIAWFQVKLPLLLMAKCEIRLPVWLSLTSKAAKFTVLHVKALLAQA